MSYDTLFASPNGRTSRGAFVRALMPLLAAAALYFFLVRSRNGDWVLVTLLYPAAVLHARRLHDMGRTAWLLLIPGALIVTVVWLRMGSQYPELQPGVNLAALVISVGFLIWALVGPGQPQANRFGEPAAA